MLCSSFHSLTYIHSNMQMDSSATINLVYEPLLLATFSSTLRCHPLNWTMSCSLSWGERAGLRAARRHRTTISSQREEQAYWLPWLLEFMLFLPPWPELPRCRATLVFTHHTKIYRGRNTSCDIVFSTSGKQTIKIFFGELSNLYWCIGVYLSITILIVYTDLNVIIELCINTYTLYRQLWKRASQKIKFHRYCQWNLKPSHLRT